MAKNPTKNLNYWDKLIANKITLLNSQKNKFLSITNYYTNCNTQRPSDTNDDLRPSTERPSDFVYNLIIFNLYYYIDICG